MRMENKPDDVPSLEELGADQDVPNWWDQDTTITVSRYTKAALDKHRDGRPWDMFLEQLRQEHADPLTFNDVQQIIDELKAQIDGTSVDNDEIAANVAQQFQDDFGIDADLEDEILVGEEILENELQTIANRLDDLETQLRTIEDTLQTRY